MKTIVLLMLALLLTGCSSSFNETKQVDDKAYIQLTGNVSTGSLLIDGKSINLENSDKFKIDGNLVAKFEVGPGTHLIEVINNDVTLVKRRIYVTNGNVFEVNIPWKN